MVRFTSVMPRSVCLRGINLKKFDIYMENGMKIVYDISVESMILS